MKDTPERYDLAQQWSTGCSASFTQRPGIKRVDPAGAHPADHDPRRPRALRHRPPGPRGSTPDSPVARNYDEVMDRSERFAVVAPQLPHVHPRPGRPRRAAEVARRWRGRDPRPRRASRPATSPTRCSAAKITVRRWLSPRDVAALGRLAFDPEFAANVQNRPDDLTGVDPVAIGPMYPRGAERPQRDRLTDSGVHTTMWIHEWPRSDAPVGFVSPIVFARHAEHRGGDHAHPLHRAHPGVGVEGDEADRGREEGVARQREAPREARRGRVGRGRGGLGRARAAGAGDRRTGTASSGTARYLTVTAPDEERLDQAIAGMRNALSRAGMEAQILYCQQAEALMVNALPIGLGMK